MTTSVGARIDAQAYLDHAAAAMQEILNRPDLHDLSSLPDKSRQILRDVAYSVAQAQEALDQWT
jgi:hypothetical protein